MRGTAPTAWERFRAFVCHVCGEDCIEAHDRPWTKYRECRSCWGLPDLGRSGDLVDDAPTDSTTARAEEPEAASDGPSAPRPVEAGGDRQRGLAPDPEVGPQPPDPGTGATRGGSGDAHRDDDLPAFWQSKAARTDGGDR